MVPPRFGSTHHGPFSWYCDLLPSGHEKIFFSLILFPQHRLVYARFSFPWLFFFFPNQSFFWQSFSPIMSVVQRTKTWFVRRPHFGNPPDFSFLFPTLDGGLFFVLLVSVSKPALKKSVLPFVCVSTAPLRLHLFFDREFFFEIPPPVPDGATHICPLSFNSFLFLFLAFLAPPRRRLESFLILVSVPSR